MNNGPCDISARHSAMYIVSAEASNRLTLRMTSNERDDSACFDLGGVISTCWRQIAVKIPDTVRKKEVIAGKASMDT